MGTTPLKLPARLIAFSSSSRRNGVTSFALLALSATALALAGCSRQAAAKPVVAKIDFNHQVRPLFNQNCVACHGGVKAAGGVSFVFREDALKAGDSKRPAIVPGHPEQSELIARITSKDEDFRMPKVGHGQRLKEEQIAMLRQWITEGAEWAEHWAFIPPKMPELPAVHDTGWANKPLDRFVLARLEQEKLKPSAPADRAELLRRASFDLTGLPPSAAELAAFVADTSPDAYEKQVDRLLASPRYGERWAAVWLDLARYADSKGYEKDMQRDVWAYRDWLIDALNRNLPYDEFVIEQLAGDLLPEPTMDQLIATAFHRQTQTNDEGGSDDEEFRIAAVQDRAATTWVALNGVTFNCVQCHSHPYDPIRHAEYYKFLDFFNQSRDADYNFEYPLLRVPNDSARRAEALRLQQGIEALHRELTEPGIRLEQETAQWQPLPIQEATADPAANLIVRDGEVFAEGTVSAKARFSLVAAEAKSAQPITALRIQVPPTNAETARHTPEKGFVVNRTDAWVIQPDGTETRIAFARMIEDAEANPVEPLPEPKPPGTKTEEPKPAEGVKPEPVEPGPAGRFAALPTLSRTRWLVAIPSKPIELAPGARLKVRLTHGQMIAEQPAPARHARFATSTDPRWTALGADPAFAGKEQTLEADRRALYAIPGTNLPIMTDLPDGERRETRTFQRGNWLVKEGPALAADVPKLFPALPKDAPRNRLTLARWFTSPDQPLTARIAVNRYWEQLFGIGIVETLEDFGSVGEPPSHPELLDWLAVHFQRDLHWDAKALLKELVTSATYRQAAKADAAAWQRDPRNRLLARGPHNRLSAEMVRDAALFSSGLLSTKMHGPPVMPPQPVGTWQTVYNDKQVWTDAEGEDRWRRAVYTYWKRSSAYPSFLTFDAPGRDQCTVRRITTNTPLQALVTMNDPVYREAGAALAMRMNEASHGDVAAGIAQGVRLVTSREATPAQVDSLTRLYADAHTLYQKDEELMLRLGAETPELAALNAVAEAILNLDAALTK